MERVKVNYACTHTHEVLCIYCFYSIPFMRNSLRSTYCSKIVLLAGDGRCDSPGSSAKYCTYTLLDIDSSTIIHMEVDKQISLHYPNKAVSREIKYLHENNITIDEIITDASTVVRKMLGTLCNTVDIIHLFWSFLCTAMEHPTIHHSIEIWHKAKKLKKTVI